MLHPAAQDLLELSAPTHAGGGVYVHGFPSGPKPYEEVLTFLRKVSQTTVVIGVAGQHLAVQTL